MASLEQRNGIYRIVFRLNGQKFSRSLGTKQQAKAALALAQVKDGLHRFSIGLLQVERGDDVVTTLLSAGNVRHQPTVVKAVTLGGLLDGYLASIPVNSIEVTTRGMLNTHVRHLKCLMGNRLSVGQINLGTLQSYINERSNESGIRGRKISPVTARKEITTFYAAWTWGRESNVIPMDLSLPRKSRLRYPKRIEKPPFRTWQEIERFIAKGNLTTAQQRDCWDCVFLSESEITELLAEVDKTPAPLCIQLMFAMAAFTGVRRSEMLRSRLEDIDLEAQKITVREKKRVRSQWSTRSVPICSALKNRMVLYLENHPGGPYTFSINSNGLTKNQAQDYFTRTLNKSKWSVLRGWHVLRHSFISNCAAKNVDQRIIDGWVGHQTEEMRRRYRHLFPNVQQAAIESVFSS